MSRLIRHRRLNWAKLVTGVATVLLATAMPALAQRGTRLQQRIREQQEAAAKERGDKNNGPDSDGPADDKLRPNPNEPAILAWTDRLEAFVPASAVGYQKQQIDELRKATDAVDQWAIQLTRFDDKIRRLEMLHAVGVLLDVKDRVDRLLDRTLQARVGFAALDAASRHTALMNYLATTAGLIDLSGRLRYTSFDALSFAEEEVVEIPVLRDQLLDNLIRRHSAIGAAVVIEVLFDQPADDTPAAKAVGNRLKQKVLDLVSASGNMELVPQLARFARDFNTPPSLLLATAETLRQIGLPQDLRPGQDPKAPTPAITAKQLLELLGHVTPQQWQPAEQSRLADVTKWLEQRAKTGLVGDKLRLGRFDVEPGDWLLMRNPSPYNLFTDLSPGLFTHVGVVTTETGADGIRRMVLVDLPERGTTIPATNVDAFVDRSLNYVFLRHPDADVAQKMGAAAATLIGAPSEFDLNFRTERVEALKGKPLAGATIHTYCAGFLLLCAQESGLAREEFFPIPEAPAGGHTQENLAKLGLTFGDKFISPTGALFSTQLQLVGRREPMYNAQREIEEAIYDHFAAGLKVNVLHPTPSLGQSLRQKLAEASKLNPLLAEALANANGVDKSMDLVAGAKAAAVVETLDEVAYGASGEYMLARRAVVDGPSPPPEAAATASERTKLAELRARHARLAQLWDKEQLSPRALRVELVNYYIAQGKSQIDARFFGPAKP